MATILVQVNFKNVEVPDISQIIEEMKLVSGLEIGYRMFEPVGTNPRKVKGYAFENDPNDEDDTFYMTTSDSNEIDINIYNLEYCYISGVLLYVLIKKFQGQTNITPPNWASEPWKGYKWWKRCDKIVKTSVKLYFMNVVKKILGIK